MIGAVHVAEPATADDVRRCVDSILMERLMLSRTPSLILLNAARYTKHCVETPDDPIVPGDSDCDAFWTLYDLALSFRKGAAL